MSELVVEAEGLSQRYGNIQALRSVSFDVRCGEIVAVIGPNGSGKTTAVECVEGLRKPDGGAVRVFGRDPWTSRREVYRKLGVQLQETQYPANLRLGEACRLFASFYDRPADWPAMLRQLGLCDKKRSRISALSGGEKQKLTVVLALMGRPKLLILDELTTGLDPETRRGLRETLMSVRASGMSMIMVSHYLDDVESMADRILYIEDGTSKFLGTQDAFRAYAQGRLPAEDLSGLSLDDIYLLLAPNEGRIDAEGLI